MNHNDPHDPLNLKKGIYNINNQYGLPEILPQKHRKPGKLIPFSARRRNYEGACHFFLEDYRFEQVWNQPSKYLPYLKKFDMVLSPDFSLYSDWPLPIQLFQTYRNRWLSRYWQENGITVIPTVGWSDVESFDFCFEGIPTHSPVAISTLGCMRGQSQYYFQIGIREMIDRLEPTVILVYGSPEYEDVSENVYVYEGETWFYPSTPDTIFGEREE